MVFIEVLDATMLIEIQLKGIAMQSRADYLDNFARNFHIVGDYTRHCH